MPKLTPIYIPDGYTAHVTISLPGFEPLEMHYRPCRNAERVGHVIKHRDNPNIAEVSQELIASKILSWNVKDDRGTALPITAQSLDNLARPYYEEIQSYVFQEKTPHGHMSEDEAEKNSPTASSS